MQKIILIGGGTVLGKNIAEHCVSSGYEVIILDEKTLAFEIPFIKTNLSEKIPESDILEKPYAIINLFDFRWGEPSIDQKHLTETEFQTRISHLSEFTKNRTYTPKILLSNSDIAFYGDSGEFTMDEYDSCGETMIAKSLSRFEQSIEKNFSHIPRNVIIRHSVILSPDFGLLSQIKLLFSLKIGLQPGSGYGWLSWIHIYDLLNLYSEILNDPRKTGRINAVSGKPIRVRHFINIIGKFLDVFAIIKIPKNILLLFHPKKTQSIFESRKVSSIHKIEIKYLEAKSAIRSCIQKKVYKRNH